MSRRSPTPAVAPIGARASRRSSPPPPESPWIRPGARTTENAGLRSTPSSTRGAGRGAGSGSSSGAGSRRVGGDGSGVASAVFEGEVFSETSYSGADASTGRGACTRSGGIVSSSIAASVWASVKASARVSPGGASTTRS
ncbi:MAG: hypothetical protein H6713_02900 [Myxococcales bacterium]|nr:hypothetical protein [Myxococcales bacterium]